VSAPKVRLYIRVVLPDGTRPYLDPVYAGNQTLKKGWAIYGDQPQRFDEATYYLRYAKNGKRVYKRLGSDAQQALVAKKRLEFRLRAAADGIELPPDESTGERDSSFTTGRPLLDCITSYVKEIAAHKSKKTLAAYTETLLSFLQALDSNRKDIPTRRPLHGEEPKLKDYLDHPDWLSGPVRSKTIEGISREEMLQYKAFLEKRGNSPRTVANRVDFFQIFLHHFGLPSLLKGKDKPKYTEKKVRAFNGFELGQMIGHATVVSSPYSSETLRQHRLKLHKMRIAPESRLQSRPVGIH